MKDFYKRDRRSYPIEIYVKHLNQLVSESKKDNNLTEESKLARALLYNLEYSQRYMDENSLALSLYVLDSFAVIEKDQKDIFGREKLSLKNIPTKVKKFIIKEYENHLKDVDKSVKDIKNLFVEVESEKDSEQDI